MNTLIKFIFLVPLFSLVMSCSQEAKEWNVQQNLEARGLFALDAQIENGDIDIHAIKEDQVTLSAQLKLKGKKEELGQIAELVKLQLLPAKDKAVIKLISPSKKQFDYKLSANISIGVPAKFDLNIESQNGDLKIDGIAGQAKLVSSNGRIELKNTIGDVEAESTNGDIALEHVSGNKHKVQTSNGDIVISELTGVIQASTSNGNVSAQLKGVNRPEQYSFQTSNGTIELKLAPDSSAKVHYRNGSGEIKTDFTHHSDQKEIVIGEGTASIEVSTSNGDIKVLQD